MCLAVPGKVVEIVGEGELRMGKVDFSGVQRQVSLAFVPEVQLGDYVLVHVGFAISRIDEQQAMETLAALQEIGELGELGTPDEARRRPAGAGRADAPRRRVPRSRRGRGGGAPDPRDRHPAVDAHGGLRRPDPLDPEVRDGRAAAREGAPRPRARLPRVRDPARADRPGDRDRLPPRRDVLLVRRHAARAGLAGRPPEGEGAGRRRADRVLAARRAAARAAAPGAQGRLLRGGLRDDGARQRHGRPPGEGGGARQLLRPGGARAGPARPRGAARLRRRADPGPARPRPRVRGDRLPRLRAGVREAPHPDRGDRVRAAGPPEGGPRRGDAARAGRGEGREPVHARGGAGGQPGRARG